MGVQNRALKLYHVENPVSTHWKYEEDKKDSTQGRAWGLGCRLLPQTKVRNDQQMNATLSRGQVVL